MTRSFGVFFDLGLNPQLSKQWRRLWSETPSCSLWRHCNVKPIRTQKPHVNHISIHSSLQTLVPYIYGAHTCTLSCEALKRPSADYRVAMLSTKMSLVNQMTSYKSGWRHDDVIKWKHFPRYWPFVRGIHRSPVNSPHKGQWRGALMFSVICAWING